jgi:hypothetical protein
MVLGCCAARQVPPAASAEAGVYRQAETWGEQFLLFADTLGFVAADVAVLAAAPRPVSRYEYAWFTSHSYHYTNSLMRTPLAAILGKSDDSRISSTAQQRSYPNVTAWRP